MFGTLIAAAPAIDDELARALPRASTPRDGEARGRRACRGLLVARYLGDSTRSGARLFRGVWRRLRRPVMARAAVAPRIWRT